MDTILRIIDRFEIKDRGTIYVVENCFHSVVRIGDLFFDLHGNRFKIKGMEMFRPFLDGIDPKDWPLGLLFDPIDGTDAVGSILVSDQSEINFIFCCHPFDRKQVDEDFKEEYQAAHQEHNCALLSLENLEEGILILRGDQIAGLAIYRGWMLKPELYKSLYEKLKEKKIFLINTPDEYEKYHLFPGWYDDFRDDTPQSVWESGKTVESALKLAKSLEGAFVVKDYVKSRKHEWYDACFIRDASDKENTEKVIRNFIERQGEDLVGGVVLRRFEKLKQIGFHEKSGMPLSEEYRIFIFAGRIMIMDDYWRSGEKICLSKEDRQWIDSCVSKIKSSFVAMDVARREDGSLIIMEFGDGQVSGLQQIRPIDFYRAFNPDVLHLPDESVEDAFPEGTVILAGDPLPNVTVEEMKNRIASISTVQELVDLYASVHNKFWYIEDDLYDYEKGSEEYGQFYSVVDAWGCMMEDLKQQVLTAAKKEGLISEPKSRQGKQKLIEPFMQKYGYRDGRGWWVPNNSGK